MGRAFRAIKEAAKAKRDIAPPTLEQMRTGAFDLQDIVDKDANGRTIEIRKAYRRKPMIDTLYEQNVFSDAEYKALKHYRHHADLADKSPLVDSLGKRVGGYGGSGDGPSVAILHAARVRDDCERAAGQLIDILRAVVVYDQSLSEWAMSRHGSREECQLVRDGAGSVIGRKNCRVKPHPKALGIAKLEIQMAAKRVQAELDA